MPLLSVIVPSYKDPCMPLTVRDLLEKSEGDIEVIVVLDGYSCESPSRDGRVQLLPLKTNVGMRDAINAGVQTAQGEFVMRSDAHCTFGQGYDRILTETCEDSWIVTPRRYSLNTETWTVIDKPPNDYNYLFITRRVLHKFTAKGWGARALERKDIPIDETMAMQGSCWVMKRSWWDAVVGPLQTEGYGRHYQDSIEMVFKTWRAGGKLMVNKKTWYAHKHRRFGRTHRPAKNARAEWAYALDLWEDDYRDVRRRWQREHALK